MYAGCDLNQSESSNFMDDSSENFSRREINCQDWWEDLVQLSEERTDEWECEKLSVRSEAECVLCSCCCDISSPQLQPRTGLSPHYFGIFYLTDGPGAWNTRETREKHERKTSSLSDSWMDSALARTQPPPTLLLRLQYLSSSSYVSYWIIFSSWSVSSWKIFQNFQAAKTVYFKTY